jgi:predicted membrane protein
MNRVVRNLTFAAVLLAVGILLPQLLHLLGNLGTVFLPMHLGVIVAGYLLPPGWCLALGLLTPLLSSVLSGMPPFPLNYLIAIELAVLGFALSTIKRQGWSDRKKLIAAMLLSRLVRILATWIVAQTLSFPFNLKALMSLMFIMGLPGIVIQILWVPPLVRRIKNIMHLT